jgi:hypothetical protein
VEALFLILVGLPGAVFFSKELWSDRERIRQWWEARTAKPNPREYPRRYDLNEWEQQDEGVQLRYTSMWFRMAVALVISFGSLVAGLSLL